MKEQRFREQQDLADSLALKDRLQDNKSETSSLALAGDDYDDDEGEGNGADDDEAAAIARAAQDGSKALGGEVDVVHQEKAEQQQHDAASAHGEENKAMAVAGVENNVTTAATTAPSAAAPADHQSNIGDPAHSQQLQSPTQQHEQPQSQQQSQRAASVHLVLGHRRSDGYTFAASLDSELAPHSSSTTANADAHSNGASSSAALALAPAVVLPPSEVPDWHGVSQVTLVRADGLPSFAELYLHGGNRNAPSIGRPTLGRWLSLLGLCQSAPIIEQNFGCDSSSYF